MTLTSIANVELPAASPGAPGTAVAAIDLERATLEAFIGRVFARVYGARVRQFMPQLIGLRGAGGRLVAALGMRSAAGGPLFLEQYLDTPVERLLAADRQRIVELGNLAAEHPGSARRLILNLAQELHREGFSWVVFTITPSLVNSFRRLGLGLTCLGSARPERLPPEERADWGCYYESGPMVYAAHIPTGMAQLRALGRPGTQQDRPCGGLPALAG